jgi:hypothetical protein
MHPMVKNALAAILGYVVMVLVVFATFSLMWALLGPEGAFEPASWDVAPAWIGGSVVLGFVAALAGGAVCARVQADPRGVLVLIGLVIVLGILSALPEAADVAAPRPDDVSMTDAMSNASQPAWVAWLNPLIGALGAWLGARFGAGARGGASAVV